MRFGTTIPAASLDVPGLLSAFRETHPAVRVRLRESTGSELAEMVREDSVDLAVVSADPAELPPGIGSVVIDIDHLVLAGPPGHPLEQQ